MAVFRSQDRGWPSLIASELGLGSLLTRNAFINAEQLDKTGLEFSLFLKAVDWQISALRELLAYDKAVMQSLQNIRLRKILMYADKSPWWHAYFERNALDVMDIKKTLHLARIPPVERTLFLDVPKEDFVASSLTPDSVLWGRTSGSTTGTPFIWGMSKRVWRFSILARHVLDLEESGLDFKERAYDSFCLLFNYMGTPGHMQHYLLGNERITHDDEHVDERLAILASHIGEHGPVVLRTSPLELLFLAQKMRELRLDPPIRYCSVTGAQMEEDVEQFVTLNLGCEIRPIFGTQELGGIGLGCRDNPTLFHVWSERIYPEILDETGAPVSDGLYGKVTLTCLDNYFMPLIRYQTGDEGRLVPGYICSCRHRGSDVLEVKDRSDETIARSDGTSVSVKMVSIFFKREPFTSHVRRFQIHQRVPGQIEVMLETRGALPRELIERVAHNISRTYQIDARLRQVPHIPERGAKFKVFMRTKNVPVLNAP